MDMHILPQILKMKKLPCIAELNTDQTKGQKSYSFFVTLIKDLIFPNPNIKRGKENKRYKT